MLYSLFVENHTKQYARFNSEEFIELSISLDSTDLKNTLDRKYLILRTTELFSEYSDIFSYRGESYVIILVILQLCGTKCMNQMCDSSGKLPVDVKFVVRQGRSERMKKIPAHKFVLAISSPVFLPCFTVNWRRRKILLMRGTLGVAEHRITAKKFDKYRNTAK